MTALFRIVCLIMVMLDEYVISCRYYVDINKYDLFMYFLFSLVILYGLVVFQSLLHFVYLCLHPLA